MLARIRERTLNILEKASPVAAARLDWMQPDQHASWGGPMNGQAGRRELVRQIAAALRPRAVIETGTHHGATTEFLWGVSGAPVWTTEVVPRAAAFARWRFRGLDGITLHEQDSRDFLRDLAHDQTVPKDGVFFYLDAHWRDDLPLRDELLIIAAHWIDPVVLIDDFQVPGDDGYGYDDYGPGKRLVPEELPLAEMVGEYVVLFPALASSQETGLRRGSCVVTTNARAGGLLDAGVGLRRSHGQMAASGTSRSQ